MKMNNLIPARSLVWVMAALGLALSPSVQADAPAPLNGPQLSEVESTVGKNYPGRAPYLGRLSKTPLADGAAELNETTQAAPPSKAAVAAGASGKASCTEATTGLIRLTRVQPAEAALGAELMVELTVTAHGCAANVVVRDSIPAGASYLRSEPVATVDGAQLTWKLGNIDAGQSVKSKAWFKADKEGPLTSCATVTAEPRVCGTTLVGKPVLNLDKSGPATALLGQDVTYNLVVRNSGTAAAKGVVVRDPVPAGMSHSSGKTELTFEVGDLAPGQAKPLAITLKANQRGKVCNTATASSSNGGQASDDACTVVLVPGLKVEKTGTKEQILGRNADYEIVVSNIGDTTLQNVVVNDVAPVETSIVAAPGATLSGSKATWTLASLAPGAKVTQTIKLISMTAGSFCNTVSATTGNLSDSAKACTLWKGIPAVTLEVVDDPDPIQVGESTTYNIKVTNQGFAAIRNVKITASFGEQVLPVSTAQGSVSGKTASFPVVATLAAKQSVTYTVLVKGASVGDSRNKIVLTSDELKTPVIEEESTTVY